MYDNKIFLTLVRTVSVLTELMRGEESVRAFRERQLALSHTLPLGSYLLKPVQRVLKYHLLLGNIVKHFKEDWPGYTEIWNALAAMTGMAQHINDMKRRHEHAVRVQEIQSLLYGWQVCVGGTGDGIIIIVYSHLMDLSWNGYIMYYRSGQCVITL